MPIHDKTTSDQKPTYASEAQESQVNSARFSGRTTRHLKGPDGPTDTHVKQSRLSGEVISVPIASRAHLSTLLPDEGEPPAPESWSTPSVSETYSPMYEYVQAVQTESGHTIEQDDTPGYERIGTTHSSGSFHEFQADGSQQVSIRGDNYKLVAGKDCVYIVGNCNLSVDGDMNTLVEGNYNLEVVGDYSETIHGNKLSKVNLSSYAEIGENHATNIGKDHAITVTNNRKDSVSGNADYKIGKIQTTTVAKARFDFSEWHTMQSENQIKLTSVGGKIRLCTNATVHCDAPLLKAQGDVIAGGGNVSLITHLHGQIDTGADATAQGDTKKSIGGT